MKPILFAALVGISVIIIFCAGIWVGKATTPKGLSIEEVREYARQESEAAGMNQKPVRLEALVKYTRILGLSESQRRELHPLFGRAKVKLQALPQGNPERVTILKQFHEELDESLTEDQQMLAQKILQQTLENENRKRRSR